MSAIRNSKIEVLRIASMFLIMFGHFHLRLYSIPGRDEAMNVPFFSFLDLLQRSISTLGVGVFIAISGWFGIRFRKEGLLKYIFQVLFILWTIFGIACLKTPSEFNLSGIKISLCFYEGYWFVIAYLGLYLASPVLNTFVNHSSKKDFQLLLLFWILFQSYFSWLSEWYNYYNGYSIIFFCGIYLTAGYIRKYPIRWVENNAFNLFVISVLLMALLSFLSELFLGFAGRQLRDDNPLAIIASITLVILFNKKPFFNRIINWLAASCFTVYLIHYSPFIYPHVLSVMKSLYTSYNGFIYGVLLVTGMALIYLACTLYDQFRIYMWKLFLLCGKSIRRKLLYHNRLSV